MKAVEIALKEGHKYEHEHCTDIARCPVHSRSPPLDRIVHPPVNHPELPRVSASGPEMLPLYLCQPIIESHLFPPTPSLVAAARAAFFVARQNTSTRTMTEP